MASLIDYAVLGLLIEQPCDGDELYERFIHRFGELLPVSQEKVEDALARLEREGCVERPSARVTADRRWGEGEAEELVH